MVYWKKAKGVRPVKRRLFAAILAALVLAALILPAAADTFIYLWTSNLHDEPADPMAFTSYSAAEGYKTPSRVYDYEKLAGNMDSLEEAGREVSARLRGRRRRRVATQQ